MPDDYTPTKVCSKCGIEKPATTDFFHRDEKAKDGLSYQCKECAKQRANEWAQTNRGRIAQRHQDNKERENERSRQWRLKNKSRKEDYQREWRDANKDLIAEQRRQYRARNKDHLAEYMRVWRESNKAQIKAYQSANKERDAEKSKEWAKNNPDKLRAISLRRRARKRRLPDTFTSEQWLVCLEYFNYCCAVCGAQLRDLFGDVQPHADHWIPLSYDGDDNPGTVVENIVCLCNGCNRSKSAKMPDVWLVEKYGKRKAAEILVRIHAYFEQVKLE
jgi:hypothetical protein